MNLIALDHVVIRCRNLEAMIAFYTDAVGCSIDRRVDRLGLVHLRAGASLIDLIAVEGELGKSGGRPPEQQGHNMDHLCLRLADFNIDELRSHFRHFAIDLGDVHRNYGAEGTGPSVYLRDPEHNLIELKGPATLQD